MAEATKHVGRSADDIVESGAGGEFHRAVILTDLASAAYGAEAEFAYDTDEPATDLVRLCRDLQALLERLSIDEATATLTLNRECRRCSGSGEAGDTGGCLECGGSGYVHADEADG
jgi:hypothetical protein